MRLIQGGYEEGVWLHDRNTYSNEEIAIKNERFKQLISQGHTWLKDFIWDIKHSSDPNLRIVK